MAGGKKDISFPPHLTAYMRVAKFKSRKQLLDDLEWQDLKRKRQTVKAEYLSEYEPKIFFSTYTFSFL